MIENITKGQVFKYALLPQVLPRFRDLIASGFANLAYFMALVYRATNILPDNHIYLKPSSIGKYTIRNVIIEASNNLVFDRQHIDQIIIFFALLAGIFILVAQFFILLVAIFINPAAAQGLPTGIGQFFVTPQPQTDIAFRLLDSVFGVPNIFGSNVPTEQPFHQALHALFQLYSFGLLVVAVIILIYFIFAIVAETAQTGTPFGKRYNHVWAPIRLVVGVGMLVPMAFGLNAGQWITLYAAKFGSGFASTGWVIFNGSITDTYLERDELIAKPKIPELHDIAAFMMIARACQYGWASKGDSDYFGSTANPEIKMYLVNDDGLVNPEIATTYGKAVKFANGGDIHIRFGIFNKGEYTEYNDDVYPYCGSLVLQNTEGLNYTSVSTFKLTSSQQINRAYFNLIRSMFRTKYHKMEGAAHNFMKRRLENDDKATDPDSGFKDTILKEADKDIQALVDRAMIAAIQDYEPDKRVEELGWGGAAIWYNQIAEINGRLTVATLNKPQIKAYPRVMVYTCEQNKQQNNNTPPPECYDPSLSKQNQVQYVAKVQGNIAGALSDLFDYWHRDPKDQTGNVFIDVVNAILGTQGLFDMCENANTHPLAQLSALGKGMIESAIRNLGLSAGVGAAGILTPYFGATLDAASSFFSTVAGIGILIGFILYYIVPFLPFLYFLFAVGGWVKGIFEAMVGVPLWALAHLRIDGEGLPGDAAINGYFLVFEIFIRPILIVFGLIASVLVFGAMVKVLNSIFGLVVSNLSGFDPDVGAGAAAGNNAATTTNTACSAIGTPNVNKPGTIEWMRGPIDELFFTIIYVIMVYMIGMSCFKLIDLIPNNILRWMGQGVQTFNDQAGEPAEGLLQKVAIGGSMLGGQLSGAVQGGKGLASNLGKAAQEAVK